MSGTLYLCATPIGNLEDITLRTLQTLLTVDYIAAEDTRTTQKLLNAFHINTATTSYHEHNKYEKAAYLVGLLQEGKNIALVTDAGTPAISDPGEEIVRQAYQAGISVTSLPGACACITALSLCGLSTRRFAFEGFLPHDKKDRSNILEALKTETRTIVLYEAPHHLKKTLLELYDALGDRKITLCRELTKLHETVRLFTLSTALEEVENNQPRGEYVLVLEGISQQELDIEKYNEWESVSIPDHMQQYLDKGMEKKEAMKQVANDRGVSKRDIYQALLEEKE
ncbi:MAG: 16S rRNA (cytidine(1402)-2'-O)-methyltransferase [Clostridiaceae bacterium]|nr:16S rRNA (cytidine(1402)-2'-O)-methyltransferase [Clostridiaceae bacterium]